MAQLAFRTYGRPCQPAVMLLHGFMSSNGQWLLNRDALARDHFLVMVELWGHGDSPTPVDEKAYSIDAYVEQFESIRRSLEIDRWSLIGQSYGAGLVLNYGLQYEGRTQAVVVTNSRSAFGGLTAGERKRPVGHPLEDPEFHPRKLPYHPIHARRFPAPVQDALVSSADAMSIDAIALGGRLGAALDSRGLLRGLGVPLLLANGRFEKSFQPDLAQLRARYPELNVVDLDGGHAVNIEAADGFNAAVCEFLSRHSPARLHRRPTDAARGLTNR